jgi:hypothetical protein
VRDRKGLPHRSAQGSSTRKIVGSSRQVEADRSAEEHLLPPTEPTQGGLLRLPPDSPRACGADRPTSEPQDGSGDSLASMSCSWRA